MNLQRNDLALNGSCNNIGEEGLLILEGPTLVLLQGRTID